MKYSSAIRVRNGFVVLASIFVVAAFAYHWLGGYDWLDAVWMVVITISSVGYSESTNSTPVVQIISIAVILFGMSAAAYTFGGMIRMILEGELDSALGHRRLSRELSKMTDHIVICGFGRIGQELCHSLQAIGKEFVVIDHDSSRTDLARERGHMVYLGDATADEVLEELGVRRAATLVSALPSDAHNVFITLTARNLNPQIQIIARAEHVATETKLRQAGADRIVTPAITGARQMIRMITRPSTADLIELVSESTSMDLELDEIVLSERSPLTGKSGAEVDLIRERKIMIVAIKHASGRLEFNPADARVFQAGETLIVLGHGDHIRSIRNAFRATK